MSTQIQCPAGRPEHPVLSPNPLDVQCGIEGGLRPATMRPDSTGRREPVVCCADYWRCPIWRSHKDLESVGTAEQRAMGRAPMRRHTLTGVERDSIRA